MKCRAAPGIIGCPDFSPVSVSDGAADRKAKSHSLFFRCKETLEYLLHFFLRNAATAVGNGYAHRAVLPLRSDEQPALRADLVSLVRTAIALRLPAYVIASNRAEGSAPLTIIAVARMLIDQANSG